MLNKIKIGDIYQNYRPHDNGIQRVISFDKFEVLYDAYWEVINKWTFNDKLNGTCVYYRTLPTIFLDNAEFVREYPLSEKEFSVFRPDLPLRFCRYKELNWTKAQFDSLDQYRNLLKNQNIDIDESFTLNVPQIALYPFRPKRGFAKASIVNALNGQYFTGLELLWYAQNLQSIYLGDNISSGVGIFRMGHTKKVPSYYIGHYLDMAGFLKE